MEKQRLDAYLADKGLARSREQAKSQIIAGEVRVDGNMVTAPSFQVREGARVEVSEPQPYVSRGGLKLDKALTSFEADLDGKVCADIGASTGGFTDCMLQHGASKVYAVDVGYGQLAWKLRNDPRVVVMERTNARFLEPFSEPVAFASIDVAFISLLLVLPAVRRILGDDGEIVALIKPQFEAGRENVGKRGVVKDPVVHEEVIEKIVNAAPGLGLRVTQLDYSPVKGPNGNIEYLAHMRTSGEGVTSEDVKRIVAAAHDKLD